MEIILHQAFILQSQESGCMGNEKGNCILNCIVLFVSLILKMKLEQKGIQVCPLE